MTHDTSPEEWRPVLDFEGIYEVSNRGQVRSVERTATDSIGRTYTYKSRVLQVGHHGLGYEHVSLCKEGTETSRSVHRIVLDAFVGPRPSKVDVRHLDGNPTNNRLENLRYGTRSENNHDKKTHGTDHNVNKTHCPQGHPYSGENVFVNSAGGRVCRTCRKEINRRYYYRQKAKAS